MFHLKTSVFYFTILCAAIKGHNHTSEEFLENQIDTYQQDYHPRMLERKWKRPERPHLDLPDLNNQLNTNELKETLTRPVYVGGASFNIYKLQDLKRIERELREATELLNVKEESGAEDRVLMDDILLTVGQASLLKSNIKASVSRTKRDILESLDRLWPNKTIYYTVDNFSLSNRILDLLDEAINYYNAYTCLTFKYFDIDNSPPVVDYILIEGASRGCFSNLGYIGGPQIINLEPGCARIGAVEHEIAHALGHFHEHTRPDRNQYVDVELDNVMQGTEANFVECDKTGLGCIADFHYDYGSVMHYGEYAFSGNGQKTIKTKKPEFQSTIGSRNTNLTFLDIKQINTAYCSVAPSKGDQVHKNPCDSTTNQVTCFNGGYPNPKRCENCICPDPWEGASCEKRFSGSPGLCGANLEAKVQRQTFAHVGAAFESGSTCTWIIKAPPRTKIRYGFNSIDMIYYSSTSLCDLQYVEIRDQDFENSGSRYCSSRNPTPKEGWLSKSNTIVITIKDVPDKHDPWHGAEIFFEYSPCSSDPCLNSGTCTELKTVGAGYLCLCKSQFSGSNCEIQLPNNPDSFTSTDLSPAPPLSFQTAAASTTVETTTPQSTSRTYSGTTAQRINNNSPPSTMPQTTTTATMTTTTTHKKGNQCTARIQPDTESIGSFNKIHFAPSVDKCCKLCEREEECVGFVQWRSLCKLFTAMGYEKHRSGATLGSF